MSLPFKLALCLTTVLLIIGCASKPDPSENTPSEVVQVPDNQAILQAETDLEQARGMLSEWMVREPSLDDQPLTLGQILGYARQKQEAGDVTEATRLANLVSKFSRLGLRQAQWQKEAGPFYPQ
jgi:PBP1b-binding outer membrane lipoprotein LpoB